MFFASGSAAPLWNSCCSVVTTACTGAAAGRRRSAVRPSRSAALLSASFGWPAINEFTAPIPELGGAPAGAAAAATASAAR